MRKHTRRDVLKKGSVITAGLLISGQASAKNPKPHDSNYSFSIRRGHSGKPIKPSKITKKRDKFITEYPTPENDRGGWAGRRTPTQLAENEAIYAYNFDMIEGAPHEYIGVYATDDEVHATGGNNKKPSEEEIKKIHKSADKSVRKRQKNKDVLSHQGGGSQ